MSGLERAEPGAPTPAQTIRSSIESFAHDLVVGLIDSDLHGHDSTTHARHLDAVARSLRNAFAAGAPLPLRLRFRGSCVMWDGHELAAATLQAGRLLKLVSERGIRTIAFEPRINLHSIVALLELLDDPHTIDAFLPQNLDKVLRSRGIRGISIELGPDPDDEHKVAPSAALEARQDAVTGYQELADALQDSQIRAFKGAEIELDHTRGVVERAVASMHTAPSELLALSVYDDIDRFTVGHSVRVSLLALQIARASGATEDELMLVGTCGLLHDIGKSLVPQEVLFKQSGLDDDEWAVMAEHPRLGAEILLEQKDVHPSAIGAAYCHHMGPGGHGYPRPDTAFEPSGISKLVRICDVFEALTAIRPYKRELTPLEALAIMHREAKGFDPRWFRFFVQTIGIYPVGTRVQLDDGSKALVVRQGLAIDRPFVRPILSGNLDDLPAADSDEFAVGDDIEGKVRRIVGVVSKRPLAARHADPTAAPIDLPCDACLPDTRAPHHTT